MGNRSVNQTRLKPGHSIYAMGVFALGALLLGLAGCQQTWVEQAGWDADYYFEDDKVVRLCKAIEQNDVESVAASVRNGADVNATGIGNMTPLLWALIVDSRECFLKLLELGADPNVIIESAFRSTDREQQLLRAERLPDLEVGQAVMLLAANDPQLLKGMLAAGGDPNLIHGKTGESPLLAVCKKRSPQAFECVQALLAAGADPDYFPENFRANPLFKSVETSMFDVTMLLLEHGADPTVYCGLNKLSHSIYLQKQRLKPEIFAEFAEAHTQVVNFLEGVGESLAEAQADHELLMDTHADLFMPAELIAANAAELKRRIARDEARRAAQATSDDSSPGPSED